MAENKIALFDPASDPSLISKQDVLKMYNISYGTLYRWKRMGLLPGEWFIKKTVFTGQETFLPRELVIERINLILKEQSKGKSLDEIYAAITNESVEKKVLIVTTKLGSARFFTDDIIKISFEAGNQTEDITNSVIALFGDDAINGQAAVNGQNAVNGQKEETPGADAENKAGSETKDETAAKDAPMAESAPAAEETGAAEEKPREMPHIKPGISDSETADKIIAAVLDSVEYELRSLGININLSDRVRRTTNE
ncbi:MAG: YhbD family protein [Clostridiales bacterium]|nr:YhbD family protein [Clostridiales bacterium]